MPNPIRVAVSGLSVSRGMLKYYRESPDTRLVLLNDLDEEKAKAVAAENPGAKYTTKFEDVLASDVDMIDVSTPNHIHPEQAIAALKAGKHVLCQKPMAPTVRDCHRMCDTAKATGKTLGMLMVQLSQPLTDCHQREHGNQSATAKEKHQATQPDRFGESEPENRHSQTHQRQQGGAAFVLHVA